MSAFTSLTSGWQHFYFPGWSEAAHQCQPPPQEAWMPPMWLHNKPCRPPRPPHQEEARGPTTTFSLSLFECSFNCNMFIVARNAFSGHSPWGRPVYPVEIQLNKSCEITLFICVEYVFTMKDSIYDECLWTAIYITLYTIYSITLYITVYLLHYTVHWWK